MAAPSPFYVPDADTRDLDAFLAEVDRALDALVTAEHEHLRARNDGPDEALAA
jgi:hypothetical protein